MKICYKWMTDYAALYLTTPDGKNPTVEQFIEKWTNAGYHFEKVTHLTPEKDGVTEEDYMIDINIPRRRHDLNSMMWTAKECAGIYNITYKQMARYPFHGPKKQNKAKPLPTKLTLTSNTKLCKLLVGQVVNHVENNEDPEWLHNFTIANGFKPRGVLFDQPIQTSRQIANPVYTFDADKLPSLDILAEEAKEDGIIISEGVSYPYYKGEAVLTANGKVLSVYGVVIDDSVAVTEKTTKMLFLSAMFDRDKTRECFYRLNPPIRNYNNLEAAIQLSPTDCIRVIMSSMSTMYDVCPSFQGMEEQVLYCKYDTTRAVTDVHPDEINLMLGTDFTVQEMMDALNNPELETTLKANGELEVSFPSYREDTKPCDIAQSILSYLSGCKRIK